MLYSKAYMAEINPKFLKPYDPKETEARIYEKWEKSDNFTPQGDGEPYTIMIAPPNITGSLHIGHALENTQSEDRKSVV